MAATRLTFEVSAEGLRFFLVRKKLGRTEQRLALADWDRHADGVTLHAISTLRHWADEDGAPMDAESITASHTRVAQLCSPPAAFGLPDAPPYILNVWSEGTVDQESFRLHGSWLERSGQPALGVGRNGAILTQAGRKFRLAEPLFTLIETIEKFNTQDRTDSAARLKAWAAMQDFLVISDHPDSDHPQTQIRPEDYLVNTRIVHATAFSLALKTDTQGFDFEPLLFGRDSRVNAGEDETDGQQELISEAGQLLPASQQRFFVESRFPAETRTRDRYALREGWYVILDEPVRRALDVIRTARNAEQETRRSFARNPRAYLREALANELDEALLESIFIETAEYSERVRDVGLWETPVIPWVQCEGEQWLPEKFGLTIGTKTLFLDKPDVKELQDQVQAAIAQGKAALDWKGEMLPASQGTLDALAALVAEVGPTDLGRPPTSERKRRPLVLIINDNFEQVNARSRLSPRLGLSLTARPPCLKTRTLHPHQEEGIKWLQRAWQEGQTGVLLADDMGLGKTLQALVFLGWLRQGMDEKRLKTGPLLVVGPTGLLKNWEQEHEHHLHAPGLGECCRAYGTQLRRWRGAAGREIELGRSNLDTTQMQEAAWVLTTYETLRDYQHSFASIKFAAIVFDEMQKIKTPGTVMTQAAKAMNGDFIIGLTGTPIENRLADLWCIIDTLAPGYLGDLKTFSRTYEKDGAEAALSRLKELLEQPRQDLAPVMLRRMKEDKLPGLPEKTEHTKTHDMPQAQGDAYSEVITQAQGGPGRSKMLEVLHRMKSISLHPFHPSHAGAKGYFSESARFVLLFKILDEIRASGEKALVFVEAVEMQAPLAGFIKQKYALARQPMIINGQVSGPKRQERVNSFQSDRPECAGFDLMILSPRAGGVGLTLTAANHVIHLSRWWNPAVEDQCTDRIFRIGQTRPVHVYYLQARHPQLDRLSFDIQLHALLQRKRTLSRKMLLPPVDQKRDTETLYSETLGQEPVHRDKLTLDEIAALEPQHFEDWCLQRLGEAGYKVNRTRRSWDCGADGIAEHPETGGCLIIQCKHIQTGRPCDDKAIKELLRAKRAYEREAASLAVITNARGFTESAQELAREQNVALIDRARLLHWP